MLILNSLSFIFIDFDIITLPNKSEISIVSYLPASKPMFKIFVKGFGKILKLADLSKSNLTVLTPISVCVPFISVCTNL